MVRRVILIPVLGCSALFSGVYTEMIVAGLRYDTATPYAFTFFASLSLGLAICAALWALGFIPSWTSATVLVAATVATHVAHVLIVATRITNSLIYDVALPLAGTVTYFSVVTHFMVALALYSAFLLVLVPGWRKLWALLIAPGCAASTTLVVLYVARVSENLFLSETMLGILAQTIQGLFLGVALALAGIGGTTHRRPFALVYVQIGYCLVLFAGVWLSVRSSSGGASPDRLAKAPTRANLHILSEEPIDSVLLMDGVGQWRTYASYSSRLPAEEAGGSFAARPDRILYHADYTAPDRDDPGWVTARVTQYPNAAWATYDVINSPGQGPLKRIDQSGQHFYQSGPVFSWSSSDKLILLVCENVPPAVTDEFLNAYLSKYPSTP